MSKKIEKNTVLYTVMMVRSIPVRTEDDQQVMQDTIETYFDQTDAMIKVIQGRHPGTDVQVDKQTRRLGKMPLIESSESFKAMKRYPSITREERAAPVKEKLVLPRLVTAPAAFISPGYADAINEAMKDAS